MSKGIFIKNKNEWKKVKNVWMKIDGNWKKTLFNLKINEVWKELFNKNWSVIYNTPNYSNKVYITVDDNENLYLMNYEGKFYLKKIKDGKEIISISYPYGCGNFINYLNGNIYMGTKGGILKSDTNFTKIDKYINLGAIEYTELFYICNENNIMVTQISDRIYIYSTEGNLISMKSNIPISYKVFEKQYMYGNWYDEAHQKAGIFKYDLLKGESVYASGNSAGSTFTAYSRENFSVREINNECIYALYNEYKNNINKYFIIKIDKDNGREIARYELDSYIKTLTPIVSDTQNNIYVYHKNKLIKFNNNLEKINEIDIGLGTEYVTNLQLIFKNGFIYFAGSESNCKSWKIGKICVR